MNLTQTNDSKRAQAEIIGLAFIVVLLILGLLFYVALGSTGSERVAMSKIREARNFGTALEAAMLDTTIEDCGFELSIGLQTCAESPMTARCVGGSNPYVCDASYELIRTILASTLEDRGFLYYAELTRDSGQPMESYSGDPFTFRACDLDDPDITVYATPTNTVKLTAGSVDFMIAFCE